MADDYIDSLMARGLISQDAFERAAARVRSQGGGGGYRMNYSPEQKQNYQQRLGNAGLTALAVLSPEIGPALRLGRAGAGAAETAAAKYFNPNSYARMPRPSPANMNPSASEVDGINAQKDRLYDLLMRAIRSNPNKATPTPFEKRIGSQINDLNSQLPPRPPGE